MAILTLSSSNPRFSYVISKNPTSPMSIKTSRKGHNFGFFSTLSDYTVFFKDADTEVSYKQWKDESFEYINTSRYNSAHFVLSAIGDFFGTASKSLQQHDLNGFSNELTINMMRVSRLRNITIFNTFCPDFNIDAQLLTSGTYRVTIKTQKPIYELLNFANLLALFCVLTNKEDYFDLTDDSVKKYIKCLDVIDPPYFIRYTLKKYLFRHVKMFNEHKKLLETSIHHESIKLTFGDSGIARRNRIVDILRNTPRAEAPKTILDIGCGEGTFIFQLINDYDEYHAIDINPDILNKVKIKAERKGVSDKLFIYDNLEEFVVKNPDKRIDDVIMIEVIEHMEKAACIEFLRQVARLDFVNLMITTPNCDFNKFFRLDSEEREFRHPDHKFEVDPVGFAEILSDSIFLTHVSKQFKFFTIGDIVDGIPTSNGFMMIGSKYSE